MSYVAAVDHLHALTQELSPTAPRRKFDLDHMRILAAALGDPQRQFRSILIAGTNGKGSTAATLASILTAAGLRTGIYTSPHLSRVTERIRVSEPALTSNLEPRTSNLEEIPEDTFARLYFHVDETAQRLVSTGDLPHHPSFFESLTALAFLYFAERKIDIAVLEVGMGGRLDATNIVDPLLSVITDIALDHQDYLGNTIAEIAREKAGILRPNGTLITLPQHPEANQAIGEIAVALNVRGINAADYLPGRSLPQNPVILSGARSAQSKDPERLSPASRLPYLSATSLSEQPTTSNLQPPTPLTPNHYDLHLDGKPLHVRSPLPGEHQRRNIALAIAAAIEVLTTNPSNPEPRTSNLLPAIEAGIAQTSWPGRL
ncbi:MAG TPA: Mur ligase family protein, partial [Acidobacteriaceae bacterium]